MKDLQIKTYKKKALYDIIQYLPLDKLGIKDKYNIIDIVNQTVMKEKKRDKIKDSLKKEEKEKKEAAQKAIAKNLQAIEAILKERPELGEARISNMSWKDNDGAGNNDHDPEGMQAWTKIKADTDILRKEHLVLREFSAFFLNALRVNITKNT